MATYNDTFTRADENPLAAPWSTCDGSGLQLVSNQLKSAAAGAGHVSALTGESWDNDQTAEVQVTTIQGYDFAGPVIRFNATSGGNGYVGMGEFGDGRFYCYRVDNGTWTSLGFRSVTFSANDVLKIGAVGTSITLYVNDVAQGASFTDATHTAGSPGVAYNFGDSNLTLLDNFSATGHQAGVSVVLDQATAEPGDTITWTEDFTGTVTTATLTDSFGNSCSLTSITDNGDGTGSAVIPTLSQGQDFVILESNITVTLGDGTDTATDTIDMTSITGYTILTVSGAASVFDEEDWAYGFTTAIANGDQFVYVTADSSFVTHSANGGSDATAAGTSTGYTIDATDGAVTSISIEYLSGDGSGDVPVLYRQSGMLLGIWLDGQGYSGSFNDMLGKYLTDQGFSGTLNDKLNSYLNSLGYSSGSLSDKLNRWMKGS